MMPRACGSLQKKRYISVAKRPPIGVSAEGGGCVDYPEKDPGWYKQSCRRLDEDLVFCSASPHNTVLCQRTRLTLHHVRGAHYRKLVGSGTGIDTNGQREGKAESPISSRSGAGLISEQRKSTPRRCRCFCYPKVRTGKSCIKADGEIIAIRLGIL